MAEPIVVKIQDGEEVMETIKKVAKEQGISFAFLVAISGKLKEFELVSHGSRGSIEKTFYRNPFDMDAISGKVERVKGGDYAVQMRVSVRQQGFSPISGQLVKGLASESLEVALRVVDLKKMIIA